ncbi:MAG: hypothetical protein HND56_10055 [Pseudomonadota bacterium]|nr:hypothetical protein [Pseudomonadota bacterium]QKK06011.1 MAG: hypothetical protein HND56_10055 [Pseudomonadota bacterium]
MPRFFLIFCCLSLLVFQSGCASPATQKAASARFLDSLAAKHMDSAEPENLMLCHGHGCRLQSPVTLSKKQWNKVKAAFRPRANTAEKERKQIAKAFALLEEYAGAQTGTDADQGGTFEAAFRKGQMDCQDESMNAGMYFLLLKNQKLIRRHSLYGEAHRGFFLNGWPHRALEIYDDKTEERYVLDSWYHDNGFPAEIIPAKDWHDGWRPEEIKKKKPAPQ